MAPGIAIKVGRAISAAATGAVADCVLLCESDALANAPQAVVPLRRGAERRRRCGCAGVAHVHFGPGVRDVVREKARKRRLWSFAVVSFAGTSTSLP